MTVDSTFGATGGLVQTNVHFNGPPDAQGNAEVVVTIQN
jgi:hypothetical protein